VGGGETSTSGNTFYKDVTIDIYARFLTIILVNVNLLR